MTLVILAARQVRLLRTPPPEEISDRVLEKLPAPLDSARRFRPPWLMAHGGYGGLCGIAYHFLRPWLPRSSRMSGLLFGGGVWSVSYLGLMPALDLYPWPEEDATPRLAVMVAAHAVYGVTLAAAVRRLDRD